MKVVVLGQTAAGLGAALAASHGTEVTVVSDPSESIARSIAKRLNAARSTTDAFDAVSSTTDAVVVLGPETNQAPEVARVALVDGRTVILSGVPGEEFDSWIELASSHGDRLILSRPLRFERLLSSAKAATRAGNVGAPKTVHLGWSFGSGEVVSSPIALDAAATAAVDAALWLLDDAPAKIYALECHVPGAPLMELNVQGRSGALASLEVTIGTDGYPGLRDLALLASDGGIYHRTGQDDVLWSHGRSEMLRNADDGILLEANTVLNSGAEARRDLAGGEAVRQNIAIAQAIALSLLRSEPVILDGEVA